MTRQRLFVLKSGFVLVTIVASAVVLCLRGLPDALLATDSFVEALFTVSFWSVPTYALYLLIPWSRSAVLIEGVRLAALFVTTWWSSAVDTHSTASFGPAFAGWFFGPGIVIAGTVLTAGARRRARRAGERA